MRSICSIATAPTTSGVRLYFSAVIHEMGAALKYATRDIGPASEIRSYERNIPSCASSACRFYAGVIILH